LQTKKKADRISCSKFFSDIPSPAIFTTLIYCLITVRTTAMDRSNCRDAIDFNSKTSAEIYGLHGTKHAYFDPVSCCLCSNRDSGLFFNDSLSFTAAAAPTFRLCLIILSSVIPSFHKVPWDDDDASSGKNKELLFCAASKNNYNGIMRPARPPSDRHRTDERILVRLL
jgi:hypothetical protein